MKTKNKLVASFMMLTLGIAGLTGYCVEKEYKYGDFVKEEGAYFVEKVIDPAGFIKAKKYITPTDNKYNTQKEFSLGIDLIGDIENVWSSYTGKGTTVAILDDGFDYNHPEYTRVDGTSAILPTSRYYYQNEDDGIVYYQSYSSDPTCIAEDWEVDEDDEDSGKGEWASHGTNTSTTAAAPMNNGGGVGIAPEADILALKIDFSFAAIKAAIQYAVSQNVDVINMSLGAYADAFTDGWGDYHSSNPGASTYLNSVCQSAYNAGIIVVAAAGNESTWHKSYPACNTKVIGVGATGDWDHKGNANELAEFTNYVSNSQTGEINVDILAPGYVYTAAQEGTEDSVTHTYADTQGTSFSCPIVAGAACLWKQKYPNGTPDEFLNQLQSTADGIGDYKNKMIAVSGWYSYLDDVGPSNIENGRLNVAGLLDIDEPYVLTEQSSFNIAVGEKRQINVTAHNGSISYSSSNNDVVTVSNSGLITAAGAGNATITVTATKNAKTATANISVTVSPTVSTNSMSFSPNQITLSIGDTYNSEPTIITNPSNASRIFMFESADESVATVDDETGLITAVGAGTTNIESIAIYGDADATLEVTVEESTTPTSWDKVSNTSDIEDGDYLIVYEEGGVALNGGLDTLDVASNTISVSITNDKIAYSATTEAAKFTIESMTGGYSIRAANGNYIYGTSGSNVLNESGSKQANGISVSDGVADIVSNTSHLRYNSDANQARFRYFKSSSYTNQQTISLFKANSGGVAPVVPTVSSVTVSPSNLSLDVYSNPTSTLTATVNGTNNPAQTVTWSSSNTSIATVSSSGEVTAKAAGSATITATSTVDTTKSGSCAVTVTDSTPKTLSSISISGYKTSFTVGETFSFGGTVTATYSDSSNANVTASCTFTGYDMSTAGNYTVTVSYTYGGTTETVTYQITVSSSGGSTTGGTYTIGWGTATGTAGTYSNFTAISGDVAGILSFSSAKNGGTNDPVYNSNSSELRLYYNSSGNGCSITITPAKDITFTGFEMTTSTSPSVNYSVDGGTKTSVSQSNNVYSANGFSATSSLMIQNANTSNTQLRILRIAITYSVVDLSDKIVNSISAVYSGDDVFVGGSLDTTKVSVAISFTDHFKYSDEMLTTTQYQLTGFDSETAGDKTVTVTYTGPLATLNDQTIATTFNVTVIGDTVETVTPTVSKTYHPGDKILKSDITVTLTRLSGGNETTTDFTFNNDGYRFTYEDAPSGGTSGTKQFSITYAGHSYNFNVSVSRIAPQTISGNETSISSSDFSSSTLSKSSSTASSTSVTIKNIAFTVTTNAYIFTTGSVNYLSFNKGAGSIKNTNAFERDLMSVSFTQKSGARQDGVITISKDGSTWDNYTSGSSISGSGYRYFKIEYKTASSVSGSAGYSDIQNISYTLVGQDNVTNVANYIMYEDTNNQCLTKLDVAISKLNTMSSSDKTTFLTSNDYVITTARERLEAWARHENKTIDLVDGKVVAQSTSLTINKLTENNPSTIIVIVSVLSISAIGLFLVIQKKKKEQ